MQSCLVTPTQAGVQLPLLSFWSWISAFAGMTSEVGGNNV